MGDFFTQITILALASIGLWEVSKVVYLYKDSTKKKLYIVDENPIYIKVNKYMDKPYTNGNSDTLDILNYTENVAKEILNFVEILDHTESVQLKSEYVVIAPYISMLLCIFCVGFFVYTMDNINNRILNVERAIDSTETGLENINDAGIELREILINIRL